MYIKLYIKVLSKKLTIINKCTLLDCTNTWILMYCIPTVHAFGLLLLIHTLFWYRHTYMTFPPPALPSILDKLN